VQQFIDGQQLRVANLTRIQAKLGIAPVGSPLFELLVSAGQVSGIALTRFMGHNPDVDLATLPEDVWEGGGVYPFQTTPVSLQLVSSSANDTAVGTGLRTVLVTGLDANYLTISETVTMNGVTPVPLTKQYRRINDVIGVTAGSGASNAGTLVLRVPGPGAVQAQMDAGDGRAHTALLTVPASKTFYLIWLLLEMLRVPVNEAAELALLTRTPTGLVTIRNLFSLIGSGTSSQLVVVEYPVPFPAKSDVWMRVTDVSANNIAFTATGFGLMVDDGVLS